MKIKSIAIESFRGIPNSLNVNFLDKNGFPISTLIYGDNGTGKSSITDAIEFNLQGKIERSDSIENEFRPSPLSLYKDLHFGSKTTIVFQNGELSERNIYVEYDAEIEKITYKKTKNGLNNFFNIVPLVLRRNDIVNYSNTPSVRKQMLFWSFIYNTENSALKSITDKSLENNNVFFENSLNNELLHLKKTRKDKVSEIANNLKISIDVIPTIGSNKYNVFIKEKVKKNLNSNQLKELKKRSIISGVNFDNIKLSEEIDLLNLEIKKLQVKIKEIKLNFDPSKSIDRKLKIKKFLEDASFSLTNSFNKISTVDFVEEITISIGGKTEVSFEIFIKLKNGKITTPNNIFSEANLDLLVLLLFTSLIKEAENYGQSKVIVLDDVLQSVDSVIRLNFIEYLATEFSDWQIIITAHDKLWLNQIKSCFRRKQHQFKEIEINKWNFDLGPQISELEMGDDINTLDVALETKNPQIIASQTGLFLETICNKLSMSLNISIQRRPEDKYTIGDLFPGIKKYFKSTCLADQVNEIDKFLFIRNLIGAHYNEWALSISSFEIIHFATNVKSLYLNTYCKQCQSWIQSRGICNCGKLIVK